MRSSLENKPAGFFVLVVAVVLGLVVCAFSVVSAQSRATTLAERVAENDATLSELQAEYDRLSGTTTVSGEDAKNVVSPGAVGRAVATYQNRYYDMRVNQLSSDSSTYDTVIAENAKALAAYLAPDSQAVSGVWFACDDLKSRFNWSFRSGFVCDGDEMECLWTCADKNDAMVAFAVGTYDVSANKFGDVRVYVTQYGLTTYQVVDSQATIFDDSYLDEPEPEPAGADAEKPGDSEPGTEAPGESEPGGDPGDGDTWASEMEELFKNSDAYKEQLESGNGG